MKPRDTPHRASHTPGPWTLEQGGDCALVFARGSVVSGVVASVNTRWAHEAQSAEQVANARLIAAAPDLLAALEAMKDALAECHEWTVNQQIAYGKAHAAISKAGGL